MNFFIEEPFETPTLAVDASTIDLSQVDDIDAFGVLSLFSFVLLRAPLQHQRIQNENPIVQRKLTDANFLHELNRRVPGRVTWNPQAAAPARANSDVSTFIRHGRLLGDERHIADDFRTQLAQHGFGNDFLNAKNLVVGEAGSNSHDHSRCENHCMVSGNTAPPNLRIAVTDLGQGILHQLRSNPDYEQLTDTTALLTSLISGVTGRQGEIRGKGMSDILKSAMTYKGILRIDDGNHRLLLDFRGQEPFIDAANCAGFQGTRIGVLMQDGNFPDVSRKEASDFVAAYVRTL